MCGDAYAFWPRSSAACNFYGITKPAFFQNGGGFSNPFLHRVSCFVSEEEVIKAYNICRQAKRKQAGLTSMTDFFPVVFTANDKERAIYSYLSLIVTRTLPISIVEDKEF